MIVLENAFTIPAEMDRVLDALLDVERVIACFPGARLVGAVDDRNALAQVRILFGRASISFRGSLHITGDDREAGAVSFRARGRELSGDGVAEATVEVRLRGTDGTTTASIIGDGAASGRVGLLPEETVRVAADKVMGRFGSSLARLIGGAPLELVGPEELGATAEEAELRLEGELGEELDEELAAELEADLAAPEPAGELAPPEVAAGQPELELERAAEPVPVERAPVAEPAEEHLVAVEPAEEHLVAEVTAEPEPSEGAAGAGAGPVSEPQPGPEPVLSPVAEPAISSQPAAPQVAGTVRIMTEDPVRLDATGSRLPVGRRVAQELERRPWLVPAAVVTGIAVVLGVRRRR